MIKNLFLGISAILGVSLFSESALANTRHERVLYSFNQTVHNLISDTNRLTQSILYLPDNIKQEVICSALNIYHEARGETRLGQIAVAYVAQTRASYNQSSICAEVVRPWQFSWTVLLRNFWPRTDTAWQAAQEAAMAAFTRLEADPTRGATHYYAYRQVTPRWRRAATNSITIGNHRFMTLRGEYGN